MVLDEGSLKHDEKPDDVKEVVKGKKEIKEKPFKRTLPSLNIGIFIVIFMVYILLYYPRDFMNYFQYFLFIAGSSRDPLDL